MPDASPSTTAPIDVLVEVQREADGAVLELEQLVDRAVGQAGDAGDAVADLGDAPDGAGLEDGSKPSRFFVIAAAMSAAESVSSAMCRCLLLALQP